MGHSREAAANRYVELSPEMCAFVFVKDGRVRYPRPGKDFPAMSIRSGDPVPQPVPRGSLGAVTTSDWLRPTWTGRPPVVLAQQIDQSDGHATVLLHIETDEFEDAAEEDELVASYTPRFGLNPLIKTNLRNPSTAFEASRSRSFCRASRLPDVHL